MRHLTQPWSPDCSSSGGPSPQDNVLQEFPPVMDHCYQCEVVWDEVGRMTAVGKNFHGSHAAENTSVNVAGSPFNESPLNELPNIESRHKDPSLLTLFWDFIASLVMYSLCQFSDCEAVQCCGPSIADTIWFENILTDIEGVYPHEVFEDICRAGPGTTSDGLPRNKTVNNTGVREVSPCPSSFFTPTLHDDFFALSYCDDDFETTNSPLTVNDSWLLRRETTFNDPFYDIDFYDDTKGLDNDSIVMEKQTPSNTSWLLRREAACNDLFDDYDLDDYTITFRGLGTPTRPPLRPYDIPSAFTQRTYHAAHPSPTTPPPPYVWKTEFQYIDGGGKYDGGEEGMVYPTMSWRSLASRLHAWVSLSRREDAASRWPDLERGL